MSDFDAYGNSISHLQSQDRLADLETHNLFLRAPEKFQNFAWYRIFMEVPFFQVYSQRVWEDGAPINKSVVFRDMILPDNHELWQTSDDCNGRSCKWKYHEIDIAQEERHAFLMRTGLRTPKLCLEKLRDKQYRDQIPMGHLENLRKNNQKILGDFAKEAHRGNCQWIIPNGDYQINFGAPAANHVPASMVTPGILDDLSDLKHDEGSMPMRMLDGSAPLYPMIIGDHMFKALKEIDPAFRDMLVELDPSTLDAPIMGGNRRVGNFIPRQIKYPDRYHLNLVTGELELVQTHVLKEAEDGGEYSEVNPQWKDPDYAAYEAIDFPDPGQGYFLVTGIVNSIGGATFNPQNYVGQPMWTLLTGGDYIEGNEGFWRLKHERAFMPQFPKRGLRLLVERYDKNVFIKGRFKSNRVSFVMPEFVDVIPQSSVQGADEFTVYLETKSAIKAAWITEGVQVQFGDGTIREATVADTVALPGHPYRYELDFGSCETLVPCLGGFQRIYGPKEAVTVLPDSGDSFETTEGESLTCAAVASADQIGTILTVADVSDSRDGTYFTLQDEAGSVAFWIDTDDSGTTIPAGAAAADRAVEITTIATDDTAADIATAIAAVINSDSKFAASATSDVIVYTHANAGARPDPSAGTSGFTVDEYDSALTVTDAGLASQTVDLETTLARVDFQTTVLVGTAIAYDDNGASSYVTVGFKNAIVTCDSGKGVKAIDFEEPEAVIPKCYTLDLTAGLAIEAWTDGELTLASDVPVNTTYQTVAHNLNLALGVTTFAATDTGVRYIRSNTPGNFTMDDASTVVPAECPVAC